jgi:hypothetical protein
VRKPNCHACQDITDSLDEGATIDAIIIDFSKAFDLVPYDRLLMIIASLGVDSRVVVCIREFFSFFRRELEW